MAFRRMDFKHRWLYIVVFVLGMTVLIFLMRQQGQTSEYEKTHEFGKNVLSKTIPKNIPSPLPSFGQCRMHTNECFNIYRCGYNEKNKISVYVYPFTNYFDEDGNQLSPSFSREFYELLVALRGSSYYTHEMDNACIIVPALDTLNQRRIDPNFAGQILSSLPSWRKLGGKNHLIFNIISGQEPDFNTSLDVNIDKAILAGGGFSSWSYRPGFDISIPVFNSLTYDIHQLSRTSIKKWFLLSTQVNYNGKFRVSLETVAASKSDTLILNRCLKDDQMYTRCDNKAVYKYPQVLQFGTFCAVIRGARLGQSTLMDALMMGCIPVILADNYVLPFSEVIDWKRAAVLIREEQISDVYKILKTFTFQEISDMTKQVDHLWTNYFSSMKNIGLTTLKILNDRVFPNSAWSYEDWNTPNVPYSSRTKGVIHSPFIVPLMSPKHKGFTAVVLSYDRVPMLFRVLKQVAQAPSLAKIVVVWNNVAVSPPPVSEWPELSKPIEVIETKVNKLSNRFFPYNEIETEAIFSLDDDIVMLTADEIEFAFEVWCEFPDRLVGFPGRLHTSNNVTEKLKYESEWKNEVSMVLTGAAFHHKYFSHAFTYMMPSSVRDWVDKHMNCEDIAMNFLIANYTGKAPIKVTPRKRFKCPECAGDEALDSNPSHFMERSACIHEFVKSYGTLPLKTAEFRADPILFKDDLPSRIKRYKDIGTI